MGSVIYHERHVRAVADILALASILPTYYVQLRWIWLAVLGVNLLKSSFTGLCPFEMIRKKTGVKESSNDAC
ncbi:MAG: DUF2892 domain-containing protein [Bacteroidota bacterium]